MRWRAVLKRAVERWEFGFDDLFAVTGDFEGFNHQLGTMVTNRTGGKLGAVANDVVLIRQNVERIFVEQVVHAALRDGERVVGKFNFAVIVEFVHGEVDDPAEAEDVFFEQVELRSEFGADVAADVPGTFKRVGNKEHGITVFNAAELFERGDFVVGKEFSDRAFDFTIDPADVAETFGTDRLRERNHAVKEFAGSVGAPFDGDGFDHPALFDHAGERFESAGAENFGCILHDERVAQIGFIGAVFIHRFEIRNAFVRRGIDFQIAEFIEDGGENAFVHFKNIVLCGEGHFHIELIKLAGRTVGAGILVAEARSDLEVSVESRGHEQLFELLGSLRKRVELTGMHAARHEIVARAFGRRAGENGGLHFHEAFGGHEFAHAGNDFGAEDQVVVQAFATQVEEAILQAKRFVTLLLFVDLKRDHL